MLDRTRDYNSLLKIELDLCLILTRILCSECHWYFVKYATLLDKKII